MSSLNDLLGNSLDEMSVSDFETRINSITLMQNNVKEKSPNKADTSNKGKRLKNKLQELSDADITRLIEIAGG